MELHIEFLHPIIDHLHLVIAHHPSSSLYKKKKESVKKAQNTIKEEIKEGG